MHKIWWLTDLGCLIPESRISRIQVLDLRYPNLGSVRFGDSKGFWSTNLRFWSIGISAIGVLRYSKIRIQLSALAYIGMPIIRRFEYPDTWDSNRSESQIRGSRNSRVSGSYGSKIRVLRIQDPYPTDPRFINYESEIHVIKIHEKLVLINKIFNWIIKI